LCSMPALPPSVIGTVIRMVPVILIVILMSPAWLTWPFLSKERRQSVLQMVRILARWAMGDSTGHHDGDDRIDDRDPLEPPPDRPPLHSDLYGVVFAGCDERG
jgi:hypothetical protein